MTSARPTLLLSVDFEDWHQLVRRRVGVAGWEAAGPALERQTDAMLDLFDELGVHATFFVLGMAARVHPRLVTRVVERGHEIGCHGDAHLPVHGQTPEEFAADLRAARATIEDLTGRTPVGYRAPAFSITGSCAVWAHRILAEEGFAYDASQHDSPALRDPVDTEDTSPHRLGAGLWEFPIAVWRIGRAGAKIPVGGASYWQLVPTPVLLKGPSARVRWPASTCTPTSSIRTRCTRSCPGSERGGSAPTRSSARSSATAPAGAPPASCARSRAALT